MPSERKRFSSLVRGLLSVPKDEVDEQKAKYERNKRLRLARKRRVGQAPTRNRS